MITARAEVRQIRRVKGGRELRASELREGTIVRVVRESTPAGTTAVILTVNERLVHFRETETGDEFLARREGPGREQLMEKYHRRMRAFQHLGAVKYSGTGGHDI